MEIGVFIPIGNNGWLIEFWDYNPDPFTLPVSPPSHRASDSMQPCRPWPFRRPWPLRWPQHRLDLERPVRVERHRRSLTFDEFVTGTETFGERIQLLMRCRSAA